MKQATYKLRIPDDLAILVRGMHPHLKRKIKASLKLILSNPNEGKALKNDLAGLRSFRVSRFRIIYRMQKNVIEIIALGPRERIYEETFLILKKEARR
jgi:mRNA interferase RelE/StbE